MTEKERPMSCNKPDNNGKVGEGDPLHCGTKLTFCVGKQPRVTVVHLCKACETKEKK
jgi:hypothetical protein